MTAAYRPKIQVLVDTSHLRKLLAQPELVLRDLDRVVLDASRMGMDQAAFLVPRGGAPDDPLNLADTAFVGMPEHNDKRISTFVLSGYRHPSAGAIHAGWHFGQQTRDPPPEWLRQAFKRGVRARLKKDCAAQLPRSLSKLLPKK